MYLSCRILDGHTFTDPDEKKENKIKQKQKTNKDKEN